MKKLLLTLGILMIGSKVFAEKLEPQFRTWKSSQITCGNYSNVLISSTPIIFHMVTGSAAVNGGSSPGGNNYFTVFWSTSQPPASDMSTKAFVYTNMSAQEKSGIDDPYDVVITTSFGFRIYSYFSKQGGACPINYLWDFYNFAPQTKPSNIYFEKD